MRRKVLAIVKQRWPFVHIWPDKALFACRLQAEGSVGRIEYRDHYAALCRFDGRADARNAGTDNQYLLARHAAGEQVAHQHLGPHHLIADADIAHARGQVENTRCAFQAQHR